MAGFLEHVAVEVLRTAGTCIARGTQVLEMSGQWDPTCDALESGPGGQCRSGASAS